MNKPINFNLIELVKRNSHVGFNKISWDSKISHFLIAHISSLTYINLNTSFTLLQSFMLFLSKMMTFNCRFQFIAPEHNLSILKRKYPAPCSLDLSITGKEWKGGWIGNIRGTYLKISHVAHYDYHYKKTYSRKEKILILPNIVFAMSSKPEHISNEISGLNSIKFLLFADTNQDSAFARAAYFVIMNVKSEIAVSFYIQALITFIETDKMRKKILFPNKKKNVKEE